MGKHGASSLPRARRGTARHGTGWCGCRTAIRHHTLCHVGCLLSPALSSPSAAEDTLVRGDEKLPGDAFALSIHNIWDVIRSQKDLNLPAHKVGVGVPPRRCPRVCLHGCVGGRCGGGGAGQVLGKASRCEAEGIPSNPPTAATTQRSCCFPPTQIMHAPSSFPLPLPPPPCR